jgi:hypothetical protein
MVLKNRESLAKVITHLTNINSYVFALVERMKNDKKFKYSNVCNEWS